MIAIQNRQVRMRPAKEKCVDTDEKQEIENVADGSAASRRRDNPARLHEHIGRRSRIRNAGEKIGPRGLFHHALIKAARGVLFQITLRWRYG